MKTTITDLRDRKTKRYYVIAVLEVAYEIDAEDIESAEEIAKGYLLDKIDKRNVAYDELVAKTYHKNNI